MKNKQNVLLLMSFEMCVLFFCGCVGTTHAPQNSYGLPVDSLIVEEHTISFQDEWLGLQSYSCTTHWKTDSVDYIVGYNHFEHALDCFDVTNGEMVRSIPLHREGVDGVVDKICSMFPFSDDFIWVYDHVHFYLLDSDGEVHQKIAWNEYDSVIIEANHAMHTAQFVYNQMSASLLFPIRKNDRFYIYEWSLETEEVINEYLLFPSVYNLKGDKKFANMDAPNVKFLNDKVVYNYPYESTIYTLDLKTGEQLMYGGASQYTANVADECSDWNDYSKWERHGITNTHFYDVMYMPDLNLYVRLHLGGVDIDTNKSLSELGDSRVLYLMLFDHEFNIVGEYKLKEKTYNYFTGWCTLSNGLLIFKDNALSELTDYDGSQFDIYRVH